MKIYISGKISGNDNYIWDFERVEKQLISEGHDVVNPCELLHDHEDVYEEYMKEDLKALLDCDQIYMFGEWETSTGATMEHAVARICGIPCIYEERQVSVDER